jgi:protein Tob/BTG
MPSAITMLDEVNSVCGFIAKLLRQRSLESRKVALFEESLRTVLCTHYVDHWFPEKPYKGSAYRCIRNNGTRIDPLFMKAGSLVGLDSVDLLDLLPSEITMWVDPDNVSYRIGEDGSIGVLFDSRASIVIDQEHSRPAPKFHQSCKDQVLLHLQSSARSGSEAITASAS